MPMSRRTGGILAAGLACVFLVAGESVAGPVVAADGAAHVAALVGNPSSLVNPMAGTGAGAVNPGAIGEFPGADVPFGMIQWSPTPRPNVAMSGGGYSYADSAISGFSLTNLSGVGCASLRGRADPPHRRDRSAARRSPRLRVLPLRRARRVRALPASASARRPSRPSWRSPPGPDSPA
jgi:hypothetical protein